MLENKNILVTGASGLFGGWIVEELINNKANVTCFSHKHPPKSKLDEIKDNQNIKIVEGDTRDKEVLEILFKKSEI